MPEYGVTDEGFVLKRLDTILEEVHTDLMTGFGVDTRLNGTSFLNTLVTTFCGQIAELWETAQDSYYAKFPSTAAGVNLDNAVQYGGIRREAEKRTCYPLHCAGKDGAIVQEGTRVASDTNPEIRLSAATDFTISRDAFNEVAVTVAVIEQGVYTVAVNSEQYSYRNNNANATKEEILSRLSGLIAFDGYEVSLNDDALWICDTRKARKNSLILSDNLTTKSVVTVANFRTEDYGKVTLPNGIVTKFVDNVADFVTVITDVSGKLDASRIGTANGVAELDANGKVPSAQLPAYVDDVLEYASLSAFPVSGETGKIYVAIDTNVTYRWGGSAYVVIGSSLALGETSSSAYRGDRGKIAYDHSQTTGNAHNMTKADIGLGNVPNVSTNDQTPTYTAASTLAALTSGEKLSVAFGKLAKGVSDLIVYLADNVRHITAAERTAWNNKVDKVSGKGLSTNDYTTAEKTKLANIAAEANKTIIDASLSNTGQAADAKVTGDAIAALREYLKSMEIYRKASGNPATFSDGAAANIKELSVTITPTQSGSGDPSPDNIRPISGVASVSVTRTGHILTSDKISRLLLRRAYFQRASKRRMANLTAHEYIMGDVPRTRDSVAFSVAPNQWESSLTGAGTPVYPGLYWQAVIRDSKFSDKHLPLLLFHPSCLPATAQYGVSVFCDMKYGELYLFAQEKPETPLIGECHMFITQRSDLSGLPVEPGASGRRTWGSLFGL